MPRKEWKALCKQPETARCSFVAISNKLSFFFLFRPILSECFRYTFSIKRKTRLYLHSSDIREITGFTPLRFLHRPSPVAQKKRFSDTWVDSLSKRNSFSITKKILIKTRYEQNTNRIELSNISILYFHF